MKNTKTTKPTFDLEQKFSELAKSLQRLTVAVILLIVAVLALFAKDFVFSKTNLNNGKALVDNNAPSPSGQAPQAPQEQFPLISKYPKVESADYVRGNPEANIQIITFSDIECPFCKRFHLTMQEFMKANGDNVLWVFKHFPLDQLHSQARDEAIAVECVGKLGGTESFWKFLDKLFEVTPSNNGLNLTELPTFAGEAGVDVAAFENCYSNKETKNIVERDQKTGSDFGISGTPGSFMVNTKTKKAVLIPGALPLAQLQEALKKIQ